jgi:hypothetical protein
MVTKITIGLTQNLPKKHDLYDYYRFNTKPTKNMVTKITIGLNQNLPKKNMASKITIGLT